VGPNRLLRPNPGKLGRLRPGLPDALRLPTENMATSLKASDTLVFCNSIRVFGFGLVRHSI